jgi:WD40 repeat protein
MSKLKFILALCISMQLACNASSGPVTSLPVVKLDATASESPVPIATASLTPSPIPTATVEPTVAPPPSISPESFGKATVLHDYWPAVRKAGKLAENMRFGTSETAWAFSPDGRYVAVAGCDVEAGQGASSQSFLTFCEHTIYDSTSHAFLFILDAKTEELVATLPETGQALTIRTLAFTNAGDKLVYLIAPETDPATQHVTGPTTVKIWDIATAKVEATFADERLADYGISISPDDRWIAFSDWSRIRIWDIAKKEVSRELPHRGFAQFSPDGKKLMVYSFPRLVTYDTNTWQIIGYQNMMPAVPPHAWVVSPDLSYLAICNWFLADRPVNIWHVADATLMQALKEKFGECDSMWFSPDSKLLLVFNNHGAGPIIWEVDGWVFHKETLRNVNFVHSADKYIDQVMFSGDGKSLMIGTLTRLALYQLP